MTTTITNLRGRTLEKAVILADLLSDKRKRTVKVSEVFADALDVYIAHLRSKGEIH